MKKNKSLDVNTDLGVVLSCILIVVLASKIKDYLENNADKILDKMEEDKDIDLYGKECEK